MAFKTEMEKIKETLATIGYKEKSTYYANGVIISRFAAGEKAIHLEFGHEKNVFGEDELMGVKIS